MSTWKRFTERLMRFSGLEPGEEDQQVADSSESMIGSDKSPVEPRAKRASIEKRPGNLNSLFSNFESFGHGNNSQHGYSHRSTNHSSGKPVRYKKSERTALSDPLSQLFFKEILTDMVVVVEEKEEIHAHRAILASQSTYLRTLIEEASEPSKGLDDFVIIRLNGISYDIAEKIISFLYSGRIFLTDSNVIDVFLASNLMNISELKQKCEEHVSSFISSDSLQVLLHAARMHNARELEKRCLSFFQKNAESVFQSESFLEVSESILVDLLCKDFYISNELIVFDFVLKWGKTRRRNLALQAKSEGCIPSVQELVSKVMRYVRLISIPKNALERKVAASEVVDEELLLEVLFRKLQNGLVYSAGETFDTPNAVDTVGKPVKFYLKPRRGTWKRLTDFANETQYSEYMKSSLRPGMLLRAVNDYEQVKQGDVGEFVQYNAGIPPCQVRWQIYGNTYWLFWRDLEIV